MTTDFITPTGESTPAANPTEFAPAVPPATTTTVPADQAFTFEVGGRKYTKEDAATKITHADKFIEQLLAEKKAVEQKAADLEAKLQAQSNAQDILDKVKNMNTNTNPQEAPLTFTASDVAKEVKASLLADQAASTKKQNFSTVVGELTAVYGDKTNDKVRAVAAENGLTVDEMIVFASEKPKVFKKLFAELNTSSQPKPTPFTTSTSNTAAIRPVANGQMSGYTRAKTTPERVASYKAKLAAAG